MPLTHPDKDNSAFDGGVCSAPDVRVDDVSVSNLRRVFELLDAWNRELCEHANENDPTGTGETHGGKNAA